MITLFAKKQSHISTEIIKLLSGKLVSYYSPNIDQGNYVIVINALKLLVTGKKENKKIYYSNSSHRPGNLKTITLNVLKKTIPTRILEKSVWGMLNKNILGRQYFKRLYIYKNDNINFFLKKNYNNIILINL